MGPSWRYIVYLSGSRSSGEGCKMGGAHWSWRGHCHSRCRVDVTGIDINGGCRCRIMNYTSLCLVPCPTFQMTKRNRSNACRRGIVARCEKESSCCDGFYSSQSLPDRADAVFPGQRLEPGKSQTRAWSPLPGSAASLPLRSLE